MSGTVTECLEQAFECYRDGDHAGALEALVIAWQTSRDPGLAELIDRWVVAIAPERLPVAGNLSSLNQAWLDRATQRRSADLHVLIETIDRGPAAQLDERIRSLATWGSNPFIARVLTQWLLPPFDELVSQRPGCLMAIFEVLAHTEDPRGVSALQEALARDEWSPKQRGALGRLVAQAAQWHVREIVPSSALDRLEPPLRPRRGTTELLAMASDAPDDMDVRRVLADALSEDGDVRGEFMSLQLGRKKARPAKREKELLTQHGVTWLGSLAELFRSFSFENGFLVGGVLNDRRDAWSAEQKNDPAWKLVEWLDASRAPFAPFLQVARRLRRLKGGRINTLLAAAEAEPLALVQLETSVHSASELEALGQAATSLPALETVLLQGGWRNALMPGDVERFITTPFGGRLRRLTVKMLALTTHDDGLAMHGLLSAALSARRGQYEVLTGDVRIELDGARQSARVHFGSPPPAPLFLPAFRTIELSGDPVGVERFRSRIEAQGQLVTVREL